MSPSSKSKSTCSLSLLSSLTGEWVGYASAIVSAIDTPLKNVVSRILIAVAGLVEDGIKPRLGGEDKVDVGNADRFRFSGGAFMMTYRQGL